MLNVNRVVIAGNLISDPEKKTFQNGGSIIKMALGFLESSYFDKTTQKRVYKNGIIDVKKNFSADGKTDYLEQLAKGMNVLVEGHLGFEEWDDKASGQKRRKVVLIAERIIGIMPQSESRGKGGSKKPLSQREESYTEDDQDIPFGWLIAFAVSSLALMGAC